MTPQKDKVVASVARARAELDQALADLARLPAFDPGVVGFTAHALGNFLTVTDGTVELLVIALRDYPDPNVHNWLEGLRQVTSLMMHATNQLVTASAAGDSRLVFTEVDTVVLVRRACDYYQRVAERKQIQLLFEAAPDIPFAWTSRVATAAVLDNLVSNAVKYSPPGKRIWVRLRAEAEGVVCSVQDEGPGLTAEDQAKLFQRGVTLSAAPTGGETSTGFGLAVARELVGQLGGTIRCECQPGQGACFSFRLPLARVGRSEPWPGSQPGSP
jgi:two-component system, sensor histidine kinase LadS